MKFEQKLQYFEHIIKGLDTLFAHNIIHRDLKFENILVTKDGIAKIADFGLAKDMGMMSNVASLRCGTPYTMAPEIFFSHGHTKPYYSQKCDIWSLGVILHEIIYHRHPFNFQS
jgi:serine/threonine protein kinase